MSVTSTKARLSPEECLREYLASGKSGAEFTSLVSSLGGLAYQTAYHVTEDRGLAEEASQRVFIILNHKAGKLTEHPSLSAWVHRTSRYEADKILKRETAHRQRLEKFTMENSDEVAKPEILSRENWRLLDEAIDRLKSKDRALILARFFEGKKFREMAAETGSSEAACKVRLRRIMDKMSTWLNGRGCTLSVTALASTLGTEWSRACPPAIFSSEFTPPAFQISQVLTSMKISKMTAAGIALLIGAAFTPSVMKKISGDQKNSSSMTSGRKVSSTRVLSVKQRFENHRLSHNRLEELYQKYPNLRPREMELAEGDNLVEQLNLLYEDYAGKRKWLEPSLDINYQLTGRKERDEEMIKNFFDERRNFTDRVLEISKFSVLGSKRRHSLHDPTPGAVNLTKAMKWLRLQFSQSFREGDFQYANRLMDAFAKLGEVGSRPPLAMNLWSSGPEKNMIDDLAQLAKSGTDVSSYVERLTRKRDGDFFIDAIRNEIAETISLFETARQVTDREALNKHLGSIYGGLDPSKAENLIEFFQLKEEMANIDYHDLQNDYARVSSNFIKILTTARDSKRLDQAVFHQGKLDLSWPDLSEGRKLLLDHFGIIIYPGIIETITKNEQAKRELITWNALQRTRQSGDSPGSLEELVPKYLSPVPANASTGRPFTYDAASGTVNFSTAE